MRAVFHNWLGALEGYVLHYCILRGDLKDVIGGFFADGNCAVYLGQICLALGYASLEELFDARQALADVIASHAASMEGVEGQLRAWLTDTLRGNDADRLICLYEFASS